MAHSRLEKIGTIFSRVTSLVKTGAMKLEDRPLWYQVYQAFPPEREPLYDRALEDTPIRKIFYPEDIVRAKFYKTATHLPAINLTDSKNITLSQKCIDLFNEIQKEKQIDFEHCFDEAFDRVRVEMTQIRSPTSGVQKMEKEESAVTRKT